MQVNGMPVTVAVGNVISEEGFSLLMSPAAAGSVWKTLLSQGAIPMGSKAWKTLRVFQGFVLSHLAFVKCFFICLQLDLNVLHFLVCCCHF